MKNLPHVSIFGRIEDVRWRTHNRIAGSEMIHHFRPLTRTDLGKVYRDDGRRRVSGGRSSTARTGTAQRAECPRRAPGGGMRPRRRRQRRGARRGRRRGTFGRKARVHRPAAAAGTAAVDEYAIIERKARLHRPAVVAVAVDKCVIFGAAPFSGCGGSSSCQQILD